MLDKYNFEDLDGSPLPIVASGIDIDWHQWSEEFRLSRDGENGRWQAGFFYLNMENDGHVRSTQFSPFVQIVASGYLALAGGNPSALATASPMNLFEGATALNDFSVDSKNWSAFFQSDWYLAEKLTLTTGLRWSQDDKKADWRLEFTDNFNTTPVLLRTSGDWGTIH